METSPDGIKEVFDYAYQLHLQIEEDMKNNEYTYAMHKLKAMAHTLIDALKKYPAYTDCINDRIKGTLEWMHSFCIRLYHA